VVRIEEELEPIPEIQHWIRFCRETERGLIGLQGASSNEEDFEFLEEEEQEKVSAVEAHN